MGLLGSSGGLVFERPRSGVSIVRLPSQNRWITFEMDRTIERTQERRTCSFPTLTIHKVVQVQLSLDARYPFALCFSCKHSGYGGELATSRACTQRASTWAFLPSPTIQWRVSLCRT